MLAKSFSYGITGLDAFAVQIEIDCAKGLPATIIVGLPDSAMKESKERVRAAIKNSGFKYPLGRLTVNLSPADLRKEGASFDLAIALGILAASEQIAMDNLNKYVFLGELSLDGRIRSIRGALSVALSLDPKQWNGLIVPEANAREAAMAGQLPVYPVTRLTDAVQFLASPETVSPFDMNLSDIFTSKSIPDLDFLDVKGQFHVKRGLEVCAAGGHNCLLIGSPGTGKSMALKRLSGIMPDMTREEILETTRIYSAMGMIPPKKTIMTGRPFRSPHHTTSSVALVGGGSQPRPGEVSLAHNGILFLDELPEFSRPSLEALRQPLEDKHVTVSRASRSLQFPANFILAAAMNPCPCGFYTDPNKECRCSSWQIQRYMSKISGPLLDRIDIHLDVPSLPSHELLSQSATESSATIKERAVKAREKQRKRFNGLPLSTNAQLNQKQMKKYCSLSNECRDLLRRAIEELNLSARAHDKILKVSRTIADLADSDDILSEHIAEAIQYRNLDKDWWQ